jgi:hypothetical protein
MYTVMHAESRVFNGHFLTPTCASWLNLVERLFAG